MPRLKGVAFETAIIERYRRRESSVEKALVEMYLAGISVRRVEDITEALWGSKVSPSTISELNKKAYVNDSGMMLAASTAIQASFLLLKKAVFTIYRSCESGLFVMKTIFKARHDKATRLSAGNAVEELCQADARDESGVQPRDWSLFK